ncbi:TRAP transporter substrate-binding protein DctP [Desulfopila sp. IMCC35008]|uniref:TRAP transporter substrate-binding protein n=1 Tax=Desulfopila sp. IMCC35008 TaxID=2653858 RepID=UPI0013D4E9A8|nr:TRAP transporter substrate-binding protein DctP [Desulfopila sp. IMCC35008]
MRFPLLLLTILALSFFLVTGQATAKPKHTFKIASLAPDGSVWVTKFKEFADEVTEKTGGEVGFRIYPGGVMGDDVSMYRKMRVGQLHGGGFTMTGIATIVPDFRVMAIPFLLKSYEEVDVVKEGLIPLWHKEFADKGMEMVALTEVGFIYTMSTNPIATTTELQKSTSWVPTGDPLSATFMTSIGINPVQLSIPDVLSSLQTGLVDTVYNSLYGSIVMQWFTKARYITDTPFGYAYGVFLLDKKKFNKLTKEQQNILQTAADHHFADLLNETRKSNIESRKVLQDHGVTFVVAEEKSMIELEKYREKTIPQMVGDSFSKEIYEALDSILQKYRAEKTSS